MHYRACRIPFAGKNGVSFLNEQSILYSIPLSTENYEEYSVLAGVRDKGNMQELIQAKSFGGSGLSCLIDLEGDMIISPTNSEPFLRLDDIFMKKSDDRVISHIYQMQSRICRPIKAEYLLLPRRRDRISFVLQALDELRLGIVDTGARESDFV